MKLTWRDKLWEIIVVIVITIAPLAIYYLTNKQLSATPLKVNILSLAIIWLGFLYRNSLKFRQGVMAAKLFFNRKSITVSLTANYSIDNDITYDDIIEVIKLHLSPNNKDVLKSRTFANGEKLLSIPPGWQLQLAIQQDDNYGDDLPQILLIKTLEYPNEILSTRAFIKNSILPVLGNISTGLHCDIRAIKLDVAFIENTNPFLGLFFQNTGQDEILKVNCEIKEENSALFIVKKDKIIISANNIEGFRAVVSKRLFV